jgi:hypothetical protein
METKQYFLLMVLIVRCLLGEYGLFDLEIRSFPYCPFILNIK